MPVVVHNRLLHAGEVLQLPGDVEMHVLQALLADAVQEAVHHGLQREHAAGTGLEMKMFRSRGPALRAVVEHGEPLQRARQVQHVREMVPDGLGNVLLTGYDQVLGENGKWIDLDAVLAALPAVEGQDRLLRREVLPAQEAGGVCKDVGRCSGDGGGEAGGVVLQHTLQPAGLQPPHAGRLQGPEPGRHFRPHGQLVPDEFLYL